MESTGTKNRIQVSPTTYDELINSGKSRWLKPRTDTVHAKGKGAMKTYWLDPKSQKGSSQGSSSVSGDISEASGSKSATDSAPMKLTSSKKASAKQERLVDWMVDMLKEHIWYVITHARSNW